MKIGVIVESFRLPMEQAFDKTREVGVAGVQMYARSSMTDLLAATPAELARIRQMLAERGLTLASVCGDLGGHGFQDDAGNVERLELTRRIVDITRELGSRIITTHIGIVPVDRSGRLYDVMLSALRTAGDYAASQGAKIAIETGPETPERLAQFIEDAGSAGIGVNFDPANLKMVVDADAAAGVRTLGKWIVHTHAKDGVHNCEFDPRDLYGSLEPDYVRKELPENAFLEVPLGEGGVDWATYLPALKAIGYDGFLTIEREVGENPERDIRAAVDFLQSRLRTL